MDSKIVDREKNDKQKINIKTENFICPNCGGAMRHNIEKQIFSCSSCGTEKTIEALSDEVKEYKFDDYYKREKETVAFNGTAVVACQNCGAEITFDENQVSAVCPMCSSSQIAVVKQKMGIPPDGIISFKIDKQSAQQKFRVWVKKRWFAPNDFKKKYGEGNLTGMYLPFWVYDAAAFSNYIGQGGKRRTVTDKDGKTRTVVEWYPVSGFVTSVFDDVQICASEKDKNVRGILPYNTQENAKPYSPEYLASYYAEIYKLKADVCFEKAKEIMEDEMRELARRQVLMSYDEARINSINTVYSNVTYKHILLPMWSSSFGYKNKTYNYLINGETGKVSGDRPYSIPKIAAFTATIIAIIIMLCFILNKADEASAFGTETIYDNHYMVDAAGMYEENIIK